MFQIMFKIREVAILNSGSSDKKEQILNVRKIQILNLVVNEHFNSVFCCCFLIVASSLS